MGDIFVEYINQRRYPPHTGEMPWDKIWNFDDYPLSGVRKRTIICYEKEKPTWQLQEQR
jgi:hypothetical protein